MNEWKKVSEQCKINLSLLGIWGLVVITSITGH